jgi:hypothetical protein
MVQAKGTAVSVHAIKAYRAADVQLYSFLSLAVDRCELSASYVSSGETNHKLIIYIMNEMLSSYNGYIY